MSLWDLALQICRSFCFHGNAGKWGELLQFLAILVTRLETLERCDKSTIQMHYLTYARLVTGCNYFKLFKSFKLYKLSGKCK